MSATSRRQRWEEIYREKAEDDVSWFEASPVRSLDLIARTGHAKSAAIVDIGGGLSRLADRLLAGGYSDITVLDISSEAIERMRERQSRAAPTHFIVSDVTTWRPERAYDVWHDRAVLHFLTDESDRAAYRRVLLAALPPGGQAIIATFAPSGPERCSGLPVRCYGPDDLATFLGDAFTMAEAFEFDHVTPVGHLQRFHAARLERR